MSPQTLADDSRTASGAPAAELVLRVIGSEHDGRVLRIRAPKCTIGAAAGCTLRLRAPGVSDIHCLVLRGAGGLAVRSWSADTRLNGRTFVDAPLAPGDRLSVGPVELEILDAATELPAAAPRASDHINPARLAQLEQAAHEAARLRDDFQARLAEREQFVAGLEARLSETEALVERLRREPTPAIVPAIAPPDSTTLAEIESLKQQAETLAQQFEQARRSFAAERDAWQTERVRLEFQIAEEQSRALAAGQAVEHGQHDFELLKSNWDHERAKLNNELHHLRQTTEDNLAKLREVREMEVAIAHWRERCEEQTRQNHELSAQLGELREARSQTVPLPLPLDEDPLQLRAELEQAARDLDAETERLMEREEALERATQAWQAERAAAEAALAESKQQLAQESAEFVAERERLAQERDELQRERAALVQQAEELERQAQALAQREQSVPDVGGESFPRSTASLPDHDEEQPETDAQATAPSEPYQPQCASDVIAKLSASGLWQDDAPPEEPAAGPEPAWKSLVPETPAPPPPAPAPRAEDEDSIEAYMQRLLQRVSGESESQPRRPVEPLPELKDSRPAAPAPAAEVEPAAEQEPFNFKTFVPRSAAPEQSSNLAAMRELANSSARGALDTSSKRKQTQRARNKVYLSLFAVAAAIALGWLAMRTQSLLSYYASLSSSAAAVLWFLHAIYLWTRSRRSERARAAEAETTDGAETDTTGNVTSVTTIAPSAAESELAAPSEL